MEDLERAVDNLGAWLSAAQDDPNVCSAMKADIQAFFIAWTAFRNAVFAHATLLAGKEP